MYNVVTTYDTIYIYIMVLTSTVLFLVTHHMVSSNTLRYHIIYIYISKISIICIHNIIHDIFYSIYIYIYIYIYIHIKCIAHICGIHT